MVHGQLNKFLNTLTSGDCPIVIDCGHVDTKDLLPRVADEITLQEGLECLEILKKAEIGPTKLAILFNETYLLNVTDGRRQIKNIKKEIKSQGIPQMLLSMYRKVFEKFGVLHDHNFFKAEFICLSENNLILQCRQAIEKYRKGQNPFNRALKAFGKGFKYKLQNSDEVDLAYENSGAPGWPLVSASINKFFTDQGFKTIVCLRDAYWAPRVKMGGLVAKELFDCQIKTHAFFYKVEDGLIQEI